MFCSVRATTRPLLFFSVLAHVFSGARTRRFIDIAPLNATLGDELQAVVVGDDYCAVTGDKKVCGASDEFVKQLRSPPHIMVTPLKAALKQSFDGAWHITGALNGWRGYSDLTVMSLQCKSSMTKKSVVLWAPGSTTCTDPASGMELRWSTCVRPHKMTMTLRRPLWSRSGWSSSSPGFVFWFQALRSEGPRVLYGRDILVHDAVEGANVFATKVSRFAHRWPNAPWMKNLVAAHTGLLVEWSHGQYSSVVELAWLNGISGFGGKSTWYDETGAEGTALNRAMPDCMVMPWDSDAAEIRVYDIPARSATELQAFMDKHGEFFLKPEVAPTAAVRLARRSRTDIFEELLNYIGNDGSYSQSSRSCQSFTADFEYLLTGTKEGVYSNALKTLYHQHIEEFLLDP